MASSKRRRAEEEEEEEEEELPPSDADEAADLEDAEQQDDEQQDAGHSSKRHRSEYPRGTVKKVRVYNFMTYGTPAVEIQPGPRLNLVLGPNGTGKSSLVCALCLGLTGAPKLLGRADNIKDFIRRGADSGWVETTLSGGPGRPDRVIRCEMLKTPEGYTTRWKINGASKPMRDVKELVKDMNIQFDNLCQFLPQDKVVEFARLNPYELLIATEKAIGDSSLYDTHMDLIAKRDAMKLREQKRDAEQEAHDSLVAQNQGLEREYQRFEKKQKLMKSIQVMKKKLAWMDVKDAQEKAKAAKEEMEDKKKQLDEAQKAAKGDERPAKQREQEAMQARQHMTAVMQDFKKQEARVKKAMDQAATEDSKARQLREQINGLAAASRDRQHNIEVMKKKMELVRKKLEEFGPIPDHSAEVASLTQQQDALREQVQGLESDKLSTMADLQHAALQKTQKEGALRQVASASWQRLQAIIQIQGPIIKQPLDNLHQFTQWVNHQRSQNMFRGQVAGPLGVEIKVKSRINGHAMNRNWVDNLEQAVFFQMANFACQNRDDERYLMDELKRANLGSVKVIVVTQDINTQIGSETANLGQFGVVANLNELFDAPPLVRHALNNICNLDSSYIMSNHDLDKARSIMEANPRVRRMYSPEQCMTYVRSAYGTKEDAHMKAQNLEASRILGATGAVSDVDERKQLLETQLRQLNERIAELEEAIRIADANMAPLHQQVDDLQKRKQELQAETNQKAAAKRKLQTGLKQAEHLLADKEKTADPLQKAPELERQVKVALKRHHAAVTDALKGTAEGWQLLQQHVVTELTMRELDMQAKAMLAHIAEQRRVVTVLENEHRTAQAKFRALEEAYKRAQATAQDEHPLDAAAKKAFTELSDDREELSQDLAELEEKVDNISVSNPRVAQEYRLRKEQIEAKARELAQLQEQLDTDKQELELLKTRWLPELQRVVGVINASFSQNFSEIGCAGEVHLEEHEDYDKYSIQIKVKFREEEQLQLLTGHRQSGGERSVSTILYLIALQGVTVTPFRVVDEINQGMDPANERKVFEQLVVASCKEGTPQCFLLTPKLLPDLPFTEDITVLNIFNGALISDQIATNYSMSKVFGSESMNLLKQLKTVPVAG